MNRNRSAIFLVIFSIVFASIFSCFPVDQFVYAVPDEWIIDGSKVYLETSNVYLSADPHTVASSGWVEFNVISKQYSGDVDVIWGFDTPTMVPKRAEIWRSYEHELTRTSLRNSTTNLTLYDILSQTSISESEFMEQEYRIGNEYNDLFYRVNATIFDISGIFYIGAISWEGDLSELVVTQRVTESYTETYYDTFPDWDKLSLDPTVIQRDHLGMNRWYLLKNINVNQGQTYRVRIYLDIEFSGLEPTSGKYCWGIKRSSDTIQQGFILDPWFNLQWRQRKTITIEGDFIGENLVNFPILVNVTDLDLNIAQADGDDILFTDASDNQLSHEIETFNNVTGQLTAWFRGNLTSGTDTIFYIYYGNSGASSQQDVTGTWNAEYITVFHMDDDPDTSTVQDITSNNLDGIKQGANEPVQVAGYIGLYSQDFDGSNDYIQINDNPTLDVTSITVEFWVKVEGTTAGHVMASRQTVGGGSNNFYMQEQAASALKIGVNNGTLNTVTSGAGAYSVGDWTHLALVYDGSNLILYSNGTEAANAPFTGNIVASDKVVYIANLWVPALLHEGIFDEFRMSSVGRSNHWMNATYHNRVTGGFMVFGSEESRPPVNDALVISNFHDTNNLYPQARTYFLEYDGTHPEGYATITVVQVNITQGSAVRASFNYDEDSDVFSIIDGSDNFTLVLGGASFSTKSGTALNLTIAFRVRWPAIVENDLDLVAFITDGATNDTDTMQTNYADIITALVTTISVDDDRGNTEQSLTVSGKVTYSGSTVTPENNEFTSVSVLNTTNDVRGTDSSIVSGQWSIVFTALSIVKLETFNLFVNMSDADYVDGELVPTDTFISDRIKILTLQVDETLLVVGQIATINATAVLEYDNHSIIAEDELNLTLSENPPMNATTGELRFTASALDNLTGTVDAGNLTSIQVKGDADTFDVREIAGTPGSLIQLNFTNIAITGRNFTVNLFIWYEGNPAHQIDVEIWNYTSNEFVVLGQVAEGAELEWQNYSTGGDTEFLNGGGIYLSINHTSPGNVNHVLTLDYAEVNMSVPLFTEQETRITDAVVIYNAMTGSEITYGITALNMNGNSVTVTWFRLVAYLTVIFPTGIDELFANGTSRTTGDIIQYDLFEIANITSVPVTGNTFFKYTYALTATLDNPFFLTMSENTTVLASVLEAGGGGTNILMIILVIFTLLVVVLAVLRK